MAVLEFEFLGTGNAFLPQGRLHSLLLIERKLLIDCPPTSLFSLRRRGISPTDINTLMITHWHGDHIFGFPFFELERKYISDRDGLKKLNFYSPIGGKERMLKLCELAYPGSINDRLENMINWNEDDSGKILGMDGWNFERFRVEHNPEVDPHGYVFEHKSGFKIMHTGDSGPCESIENRINSCNVVVIEMGVPENVQIPFHFRPSTLTELAVKSPDTIFLITHTYVDDSTKLEPILTNLIPNLPSNMNNVRDGDRYVWNGNKLIQSIE